MFSETSVPDLPKVVILPDPSPSDPVYYNSH